MKHFTPMLCVGLALALVGCGGDRATKDRSQEVVSQRFIHKYGYDVSQDEWQSNHYPGQVITTMRNGVTITSTYEDGILHGPMTYTYPHSETLESLNVFDHGTLVRKVVYDVKGLPEREELFMSPSHYKVTAWYKSGTPRSIEEYVDDELRSGDYYTIKNESESRVRNGYGNRITRDREGHLFASETIDEGHISLRQTYHPNGIRHVVTPFAGGTIHGEKLVFAASGEPISVENYYEGHLHGTSTYYQNGAKYLELSFANGHKHGKERYFRSAGDGTKLVEENDWFAGKRHGLSIVFLDGMTKREWFYENEPVSKQKFDELVDRERAIVIMNERAYRKKD